MHYSKTLEIVLGTDTGQKVSMASLLIPIYIGVTPATLSDWELTQFERHANLANGAATVDTTN